MLLNKVNHIKCIVYISKRYQYWLNFCMTPTWFGSFTVSLHLHTKAVSARYILLSWTLSSITPRQQRTKYIVYVNGKGRYTSGLVMSYNVTDLQPYTDYKIRIKAEECELWSQEKKIRTDEAGLVELLISHYSCNVNK